MEILKAHKKISRKVEEKDLPIVIRDFLPMLEYCINPGDAFKTILALAHPQVTDSDPLRFFVTLQHEVIVNPVIMNHTRHTVDSLEGCVVFPKKPNIIVQRYNKCEVTYYIIEDATNGDSKLTKVEESISGQRAKMFQHEIDHLNAIYIYEWE